VLVPRPDTEILVEEVLKDGASGAKVLDLCTGSGCILLSILKYSSSATGIGADLSEEALQVAKANAQRLEIPAAFYRGDLFGALPEAERRGFDIIVSNPPYIETAEIATLMPEVREHDPYMALDGGADGLDFYRRIIAEAPEHFAAEGRLYLEIGSTQAQAVEALLQERGYTEIRTVKDYAGLDRVVTGVYREITR
jgi:release factor glutamine methyltransferase